MRGTDKLQESLFTVAKLEDFVPADHPLRPIRLLVNEALGRLNGLFNAIYADTGRESIAPEKRAAHALVAGVLLGALGAPDCRAVALQPVVSLVRGDGH